MPFHDYGLSQRRQKNPVGSIDLTIYFKADPRTHMPIYGQSIYCMDVNFDGHGDLVVWTEYFEDIKRPVYTVYLFDPAQKTFVLHKKLSDLCCSYNSDILKADNERKRLIFYTKTGCCLRMWHEYIMQDDEPVGVYSKTEYLTSDGEREWLEISEGVPVEIGGDTWDWQNREEPKPDDYGDTAREMRPDYKR